MSVISLVDEDCPSFVVMSCLVDGDTVYMYGA